MGKKKLLKRGKAPTEELQPSQPVQGMKRKRISATGGAGPHPCPDESPSRKKKSLSQFTSPSPNSKKRMQAAIAAARETKKPTKKFRPEVGVQVPVLSPRAFEHVLALDAALRAAGEARVNSTTNSPTSPSQIGVTQEQLSPPPVTTAQASGVHVHIYVTPPQVPQEQRPESVPVDSLVRARHILEFPRAAPLAQVHEDAPRSSLDRSPLLATQQLTTTELPKVQVRRSEPATEKGSAEPVITARSLPMSPAAVVFPNGLPENNLGEQGVQNQITAPITRGRPEIHSPELNLDTAPENELNCTEYGEEREGERAAPVEPQGQYLREFVDRLLSLLNPHERAEFLRTHPMALPPDPLPELPQETDVVGVERDVQTEDTLARSREDGEDRLPNSEAVVLSSTRSTEIRRDKLLADVQFQKTLYALARDEKRYKKKQAKKTAREEKGKLKAKASEKVIPRAPSTPKPPLFSGRPNSSPVDPSRSRAPRKDVALSSGGSSGTPSSSAAIAEGDSAAVLSKWDSIFPIPPFQVNALAAPTGDFWEHMRRFALDQAPYEFPWHLDWNKQSPELKARFVLNMRKVYPGPWDAKSILRAVGANLRERRTRLKRKFEKSRRSSLVARPLGCSKESWLTIYESTKDAMKQRKAKLCKEAADKHFKVQGPTHRCGPRGLKGIHDRFVDFFNRPPTDVELEYGKMNGWADLKLKTEKDAEIKGGRQGRQISLQRSPATEPTPADPNSEDGVKNLSSSSSDTSSSDNSKDSSSDGDSSTSDSEDD